MFNLYGIIQNKKRRKFWERQVVDKSYKNYYTELLKINPEINIKDLNYIVRYGYGYMFKFLVKGCDIIFKRDKFFFKIGYLQKDPLKAYQYYKRKLYKKILFGEFLK